MLESCRTAALSDIADLQGGFMMAQLLGYLNYTPPCPCHSTCDLDAIEPTLFDTLCKVPGAMFVLFVLNISVQAKCSA